MSDQGYDELKEDVVQESEMASQMNNSTHAMDLDDTRIPVPDIVIECQSCVTKMEND